MYNVSIVIVLIDIGFKRCHFYHLGAKSFMDAASTIYNAASCKYDVHLLVVACLTVGVFSLLHFFTSSSFLLCVLDLAAHLG